MKTLILAFIALLLAITGNSQIEINSQPKFTLGKTITADELPEGVITNYYRNSKLVLYKPKKRKFQTYSKIGLDLLGGYTITTSDNYIVINSPGYSDYSPSDTNAYVLFSNVDNWNYRIRVLEGSVCSCSKLKAMRHDGSNVQNVRSELCYTSSGVPLMWCSGNDNKRRGKYEWRTHYFALYN